MGGSLLTNRGVTGFSQYGETYLLMQEPYVEYVDLSASPIALPTSEPAEANLDIPILASHVPTIYPANAVRHITASPTYAQLYKTYYIIRLDNTTGANITCSRKYISSGSSWSSASTFVAYPASTPRWTLCVSTGKSDHAVGGTQGFKLWAASAGVNIVGYYKGVMLNSGLTTPGNAAVADLRIVWGKLFEPIKALGGAGAWTFVAGYPVYGTPDYFSTSVTEAVSATAVSFPFYYPHPTSGFGSPLNMAFTAYSETSDVIRTFIFPKQITCRVIR